MTDASTNHQDRPSKRCKVSRRVSYGHEPTEFNGVNKEQVFFDIHNFADLKQKKNEIIITKTIQFGGHQWKLAVYPRGHNKSAANAEYVCIFLYYVGENTETNPVIARASFRIKTKNYLLREYKYSKEKNNNNRGVRDFKKREDIIRDDLNERGTLTIEVEIEIATEKQSVWSPKYNSSTTNNDITMMLYQSIEETSDVTFVVGSSKKEIKAHKNILAVQARELYELVITEEESSSSLKSQTANKIVLPDIDADAFEVLLKFAYGMSPDLIEDDNGNDDDDDDNVDNDDVDGHEDQAKSILLVADRYRCTALKLHIESYMIRNILVPAKAARLLLLADSYSCPLLKEACMNVYITDPKIVKESEEDWKQLQESTKLLIELLDYATSDRKKYSSYINDGNGTIHDADDYDVRSLRERLEAYDLDLDGSREMLLQRWKEYLERPGP